MHTHLLNQQGAGGIIRGARLAKVIRVQFASAIDGGADHGHPQET
jgi:hypothetical protein